jgi:small subunit ribosomal protein S21
MESDDFVLRKKGMTVKVFNNEIDKAIAMLKRRMNNEGVNRELRKRKHFEAPSVIKRRKKAEAVMRWRKRYAQIMELDLPAKPNKTSKTDKKK